MEWIALVDSAKRPIYAAIADAIELAIGRGMLRPGDRLPPHRVLARQLSIDFTTVTRAYAEARRRGLLDATVGRGTFVRAAALGPAAAEESAWLDMGMNLPPQPQEPSLRAMLRDGLSGLLQSGDPIYLMSYRAGAGSRREREAGAAWLDAVLGQVEPDRILLCAGAQAAFTAILTLLARSGSIILTDPLVYPNFRALAAHLGIQLVPVESDQHGIVPEAVDLACRNLQPQAIYCTAAIHNPTTVTMPAERRQALATVAARHNVPVIEDDAYGLLPSHPQPALATFAPQHVYYVATLSKCLSPGFRLAYIAAPSAAEAQRLTAALRATSLMPSPLMATLITQWIGDGRTALLRDGIRNENIARQKLGSAILPLGSFDAHAEGPHLWLTLPDSWHRLEFVAYARQRGLALVPSDAFLAAPHSSAFTPPNAVRVCLGAAGNQMVLRAALESIAEGMRLTGSSYLTDVV